VKSSLARKPMTEYRTLLFVPLLCVSLTGCAAHTNLEPSGKGTLNANVSVGGPVVSAFGAKLPVPYGTLGFNYGMADRFDLTGNVHLLPLAYDIMGFDLGTTWYPVLHKRYIPTVGIQPRLLILASFKSGMSNRLKAYPLFSTSAAWNIGAGLAYTGFDATMPASFSQYDPDAPSFIFSPLAGYRWRIGRKTFFITELKWHASNVRSDQLAVEYLSLARHGALATLFSIIREW
jgi:hypothetical protein